MELRWTMSHDSTQGGIGHKDPRPDTHAHAHITATATTTTTTATVTTTNLHKSMLQPKRIAYHKNHIAVHDAYP
jgi:hypothetical protein